MKIRRIIKNVLVNVIDKIGINRSRKNEINKFKDKRRKDIYSKIQLTSIQEKGIDEFYKKNYGHKIPYTWHKHYYAFTGNFDKRYFPELLYIPEFEKFMNMNKGYNTVLSDKNFLPLIANSIGIEIPKTYICCACGVYKDTNYNSISKKKAIEILKNIGECFVKPTIDSCSGQGCMLLNMKNGIDQKTNKQADDIIDSLGDNFVIQECIKCHDSISKIYDKSVNTFRVITYRWKDEIINMPAIMRIGRNGNFLDNAHAGGMFIAIDNDGILHAKAVTEFKEHPDSKIVFKGYKIENFEKVINAAKNMHYAIPQIGVVNWDFTINKEGEPVLIEANVNGGSVWLIEMAHGKGAFEERTEEVLQWLRLMKKTKVEDRKNYLFGKMKDN